MKNMYNFIPEEWVTIYDDSPAMQLIRMGREEVWAEAEAKIAQERKKIEAEARKKEAEARRKEAEARKKEAEARRKAEAERKETIAKMLNAGLEKAAIAEFLGLSRQKLAAYIRKIEKDTEK
ncbi:MAG: hypothetical protein R3C61_17640 [Bacteroidia bacterium]